MPNTVQAGRLRVGRKQLVAQDLAMGEGTVNQVRDGEMRTFDKIGADTLRYDEDRTLRQAIDAEKAREFAFLSINPVTGALEARHDGINTFRISDAGDLIHEPELETE